MQLTSAFTLLAGLALASTATAADPTVCNSVRYDFNSPSDLDNFVGLNCASQGYVENGQMVWALTKDCTATTYAYKNAIPEGKVTGSIKAGDKSGLVTAFIMMGWDPNHKDELDIEWVGKTLDQVQTMVFVNGTRDSPNSYEVDDTIPSGVNTAFHTYSIDFTKERVIWAVDGKVFRTITNDHKQPFPQYADHLQFGVWDGSDTGGWAGKMTWDQYSKVYAYMDWVQIETYCGSETSSAISSSDPIASSTSVSSMAASSSIAVPTLTTDSVSAPVITSTSVSAGTTSVSGSAGTTDATASVAPTTSQSDSASISDSAASSNSITTSAGTVTFSDSTSQLPTSTGSYSVIGSSPGSESASATPTSTPVPPPKCVPVAH
ncbi:transglycosylase [Tieghemiomyces parasiticus]|uniref:Transglycosylase n=1 Tax=Tieghemiomyces parasiticus TaxID=78921 RepID=A0A9W8DSP9_9FUNG|nr:transglycosylase [Tieghemiomyces parasiticus]